MIDNMQVIFNANTIVIVGASETPGKAGERRTRSLIESGYKGKIFPINPKRDTILSITAFPDIKDVKSDIDLVMAAVPAHSIIPVVSQSAELGAKGVIIITATLGETVEERTKCEKEILNVAKETGLRIIGPNCSGIFNAKKNINLLGVPQINQGPFSLVVQSGNVIDSLCHYARLRGTGFSKIASVGNAIDIDVTDYLEFLKDDPDTAAILLYVEGINDGTRFIKVASEVSQSKPIVAIKVGRSAAGSRAAATHTGSITGDEDVVRQAFNQAGIIRAYSTDEMFDIAKTLVGLPRPRGRRIVVLSEGGGDNAITVDNVAEMGLKVDVLSEETQAKLNPFILEGLQPCNPIDYGGKAEENPHQIIPACCDVCMADDSVDMLLITGFFGGFKDIIADHVADFEAETSHKLVELVNRYRKPIIMHTSFANEDIDSLRILERGGIPVIGSSERAARCAWALVQVAEKQRRFNKLNPVTREKSPDPLILTMLEKLERGNLLETESREILKKYHIATPDALLAHNKEEVLKAAEHLSYPLVLKISSPDIIHKSDLGGVKLNLKTVKEINEAYDDLIEKAQKITSRIEGVLVSTMMPLGEECIVGMLRDRNFGPVLMFGLGGIFTEVLKDVSLRVLPCGQDDIVEMIEEIKGFSLLSDVRGRGKKDIDAIKEILKAVAQIAIDYPQVQEIDLNPITVYETGAWVLDSRIIIRQP